MAVKDSGKVTITLDRTTVTKLRAQKKGMETWDGLMQRLGERRRYGLECIICGTFQEGEDKDKSPNMLAKEHGWRMIYSGAVYIGRGGIATQVELGYICPSCGDST